MTTTSSNQSALSVSLDHFSLSYRARQGKESLRVLDDMCLSVDRGEFVAIVGPSGCGKTSLLRVVGGLLDTQHPEVRIEGFALVDGLTPTAAKKAGNLGFAFQNPVLLPWRTVRQNVQLPIELLGRDMVVGLEKANELLSMVGINEFQNAFPRELSGGMQQRVNIVRALIHEPRVLLLDEPFGALDEVTRERLNIALLRLHQVSRPTVLFVTHSLREAVFLAQRIIILTRRPAKVHCILESILPKCRSENIDLQPEFTEMLTRVKKAFAQLGASQ